MDAKLNSEATVLQSLKDIFVVAAYKLLARMDCLETSVMGMINEQFIISKCYTKKSLSARLCIYIDSFYSRHDL
jgi:hypothetical protein